MIDVIFDEDDRMTASTKGGESSSSAREADGDGRQTFNRTADDTDMVAMVARRKSRVSMWNAIKDNATKQWLNMVSTATHPSPTAASTRNISIRINARGQAPPAGALSRVVELQDVIASVERATRMAEAMLLSQGLDRSSVDLA
jgi:hypothetical protein